MDDDDNPRRDKNDSQYIIQPTDPKIWGHSKYQTTICKSTISKEHKTQPVSYEAFSSAKAMQQIPPEIRQDQFSTQNQKGYSQQCKKR
ncbi:hypothetical protein CEXT_472651 [Caerostris extrusa]|uniref:Uncharacterized protein n=1 Tax=Caerostris extrusa TaxID=172846 RepID=A0AAV4QZG1_CAEEX|nr:hypothetical protein CEXT_472651 [Caerostris extrusa]